MNNLYFLILKLLLKILKYSFSVKVCRSNNGNSDDACSRIKKGESSVTCEPVLDATDCALKLIKNQVDFGVFTPDELLLTYQTFPNRIRVSHELRHRDRVEGIYFIYFLPLLKFFLLIKKIIMECLFQRFLNIKWLLWYLFLNILLV